MKARLEQLNFDGAEYMRQLGRQARAAALVIGQANTAIKNRALLAIAERILAAEKQLLAANKLDLQAGHDNGLDAALLDRLTLTPARIHAMAEGMKQVATLTDPVGEISGLAYRPSGLASGSSSSILSRSQLDLAPRRRFQTVGRFSQRNVVLAMPESTLLLTDPNYEASGRLVHLAQQLAKICFGVHHVNRFKAALSCLLDAFD
jgi:hypothetical protein